MIEEDWEVEGCDFADPVAYIYEDVLVEQIPAIQFCETEEEAMELVAQIKKHILLPNLFVDYDQAAIGYDIHKNY
ncbi:MAG: hypothetical protein ACRCXZ_07130 [Patescibacteria group bacterium]